MDKKRAAKDLSFLTQMSDLSESLPSVVDTLLDSKPAPKTMELKTKDSIPHEGTPESSEASFKSPSSTDDTASLSTQPPITKETLASTATHSTELVEPMSPPVKRVITFDFKHYKPVVKKQKKCCGRCSEFAGICKSLERNAKTCQTEER